MNEKEIRARIEKLEEVKLQYTSWLSHNYNKADSEEFKQNKEYVEQIENEIKQLHEKLRTAEIFPEKKFETEISKSSPNLSQEYGSSGYSAIDAQKEARERFYGMSKFKMAVAKITGKKKKFEALANKAYDSMTPQEEQALANEIGKMFR